MDTFAVRFRRVHLARLASASFIVVAGVFVGARLLGAGPWTLPAFDLWAYWLTRDGLDYGTATAGVTGAYLYSPAFAQLISPLTALPWPVFAGIWTALVAATLLWLGGRYAILLGALPPIAVSIGLGQLDLAFAAVVILGFRWPAAWALPILTKVTPGIGLVWFLVRREWRQLGIALATTLVVVAVSVAIDPGAWIAWFGLLGQSSLPSPELGLVFLPIPVLYRLPFVVALIAWGALTDRRWTMPVGVLLALPIVWVNSPTILVALLPLAAAGATTPAGTWLRARTSTTERRIAQVGARLAALGRAAAEAVVRLVPGSTRHDTRGDRPRPAH